MGRRHTTRRGSGGGRSDLLLELTSAERERDERRKLVLAQEHRRLGADLDPRGKVLWFVVLRVPKRFDLIRVECRRVLVLPCGDATLDRRGLALEEVARVVELMRRDLVGRRETILFVVGYRFS